MFSRFAPTPTRRAPWKPTPAISTAAAQENRLGEIPGIGKAIADKITELVTTGELAYSRI